MNKINQKRSIQCWWDKLQYDKKLSKLSHQIARKISSHLTQSAGAYRKNMINYMEKKVYHFVFYPKMIIFHDLLLIVVSIKGETYLQIFITFHISFSFWNQFDEHIIKWCWPRFLLSWPLWFQMRWLYSISLSITKQMEKYYKVNTVTHCLETR